MIATDAQLYTAGIVPFKPDGSVDSTALDTFHRRLNELGVDGIFAAGTTAEFATLDDDAVSYTHLTLPTSDLV